MGRYSRAEYRRTRRCAEVAPRHDICQYPPVSNSPDPDPRQDCRALPARSGSRCRPTAPTVARCSRRWPTRSGCGCSPRPPSERRGLRLRPQRRLPPSQPPSATTSRCCTRPGCSTQQARRLGLLHRPSRLLADLTALIGGGACPGAPRARHRELMGWRSSWLLWSVPGPRPLGDPPCCVHFLAELPCHGRRTVARSSAAAPAASVTLVAHAGAHTLGSRHDDRRHILSVAEVVVDRRCGCCDVMFDLDAVSISIDYRSGAGVLAGGEVRGDAPARCSWVPGMLRAVAPTKASRTPSKAAWTAAHRVDQP